MEFVLTITASLNHAVQVVEGRHSAWEHSGTVHGVLRRISLSAILARAFPMQPGCLRMNIGFTCAVHQCVAFLSNSVHISKTGWIPIGVIPEKVFSKLVCAKQI